ncbi:ABC transporter substrate-binding protein [Enterocloster lavalensis]|uniref:ABC transporter substrate-binding protein n=1 Tax=Enterocloster lavalensis TaxID=460384 RepID=UPI001D061E9D|nr:extracellular solute-binding protein [Enterocloster lavalensis]MCB6342562.1 extracellular solute-binding protein [Enterocloster lavalensis]
MRGWKKRLLCTMLAGVTVLSGCSAGGSGASGSSAGESSGEQTTAEAAKDIVVWTGQRADAAYRDELLKSYNEAHPESNVKMEIFTEDYATTLELAFTSKQAPDIFQVVNNAQYYVERDMLLPLDEFITDEFKARFGDLYSIDQVNNVDGKMYTLTERGITYRLLYNKDIFEQVGIKEPPKNMDEVYEYAKQITEWGRDQGIYGFAMQLKTPASVGERVIDQVGFRNGISAYDYQKGTYDYSVMAPVLEPFCRMYEEQIMFPGVEGLDIDPLRTQFAAGKIGMYIYGNWESTIYAENGQFPAQCQWGVVPIPGVGTDNPTGRTDIKNAGKSWGIASTCQNPKEAWEYISYMLSDDYMTGYHEQGYGTVIIPSVVEKAKSPDIPGAKEFGMSEELDMIWPVRPDTAGLKLEGKNAYDVYASIILGATEMDEGLNDLTKRYNEGLDKSEADGVVKRVVIPDFTPAK